ELAETLRDGSLAVESSLEGGSFKAQLRRADKSGARFALILGEDEVTSGQVALKPLRTAEEQVSVPLGAARDALVARLGQGWRNEARRGRRRRHEGAAHHWERTKAGPVDGLVSEKEQIEALRNWWRENGLYIVAGIVLGVVLHIGWRWWEHEQAQSAGEASALYESLVEDVADLRVEAARTKNERMQAEYAKTVYAAQARLAMAKLYMDLGRDRDAARELEALVNADRPADEIALVGRLRLARIL